MFCFCFCVFCCFVFVLSSKNLVFWPKSHWNKGNPNFLAPLGCRNLGAKLMILIKFFVFVLRFCFYFCCWFVFVLSSNLCLNCFCFCVSFLFLCFLLLRVRFVFKNLVFDQNSIGTNGKSIFAPFGLPKFGFQNEVFDWILFRCCFVFVFIFVVALYSFCRQICV